LFKGPTTLEFTVNVHKNNKKKEKGINEEKARIKIQEFNVI
jgi:hypothetical protein